MATNGLIPISILPIANGAGGNPPFPSNADYVPVIIWDAGKIGGAGFRTARIPFSGLLLAPLVQRLSPRIHIAAGSVIVDPNDTFIAVNKTVAAATTVVFPLSANKNGDCVIKDGKGDSDTNNISITFTGGQLCDTLATIVIATPFDEFRLTPNPNGGYWLGK